jgi:hypothetical protein
MGFMKARSILILLFAALLFGISMFGSSVAISGTTTSALSLSSGPYDLKIYGKGYNDVLVTFEVKMSVQGCPMALDTRASTAGFLHAYIPRSCRTLSATSTITVTYRDPNVASVKLELEQGVGCSDGYRCDNGEVCAINYDCANAWAGEPGYLYARGIRDSTPDGDSMTLTQTVNLAAATTIGDQTTSARVGTVGSANMLFHVPDYIDLFGNPVYYPSAGVTGLYMDFEYRDLTASDSSLLKGGAKDNKNTEFDGV